MLSPVSPLMNSKALFKAPEIAHSKNSTAEQSGRASFEATVKELATGAIASLQNGEVAATLGVQGKLSASEVVQAVMAAEQTLQTAVTVRDKVVSAYLDLTKMSI